MATWALWAAASALCLLATGSATADLREDIERCASEAGAIARLDCYDTAARHNGLATDAAIAEQAAKALDREFTFSGARLRDGPLSFQVPVKGAYAAANRAESYPMPEVEDVAGRIRRALQDHSAWRLRAVVQPLGIEVSRAIAYSGAELKVQAEKALAHSGLEAGRYAVEIGVPLGERLTADQRHEAQASVEITIVGLGGD